MGFLFHRRSHFLYLVDPLIPFLKLLLLHLRVALGINRNENCPSWRASLTNRAGHLSAFSCIGFHGLMYTSFFLPFFLLPYPSDSSICSDFIPFLPSCEVSLYSTSKFTLSEISPDIQHKQVFLSKNHLFQSLLSYRSKRESAKSLTSNCHHSVSSTVLKQLLF